MFATESDPGAWPGTPAEARDVQLRLRDRVIAEDRLGPVRLVAGADALYRGEEEAMRGAVACLSFPDLALGERAIAARPCDFPYVPGLLSFREAPAILAALARLSVRPDLLLVDGQGLAHPRRFGIACHIGVLADLPTIGVAKSRLIGRYEEPGGDKGAWRPLRHKDETVGAVLRTRAGTRPVFVSVGHRVSLATALDYVLRCTPRFRLPEPIRQADRLSRLDTPGNQFA